MPTNITGASTNSFTFDADTELHDGVLNVTATGAGVSVTGGVLDFGNVTAQGVEQVAYFPAHLVVDVSVMDRTTGDETYAVIYQLADDDADFSMATRVLVKARMDFGEEVGLDGTAQAATAIGRNVIAVDNELQGELFRFARISHLLAGMTPILHYTAFLSRVG